MAKRLSVILTDRDERVLGPFIDADSVAHHALERWAVLHDLSAPTSEAATIRALLQAGAEALSDEVLDEGYAELAETFNAAGPRTERRASRDRYVSRTESGL
jgi:hypothetical protein